MDEILKRLDKNLSTLRPDFYPCLRAPLTDSEIDKLEIKYDVKIPADLRALYKWKNGRTDDCYKTLVNNSEFLPLDLSLEYAKELTSMIGTDFEIENWWNKSWLPLFDNGGGDHICYDLGGVFTGQVGQIIEFWHADNDRNVISPTLADFLASINDYLESTPPADYERNFPVKEPKGFPKEFRVE